ncbi:hypothetical protein [Streptomyces sp. 1331.2]|uniref:hypothetical protein n=1 Tax=Streptomyces sp. 1331.2 TaxID=1938835 RepID=UPI000BD042A7|nr:hypothetical protein [Streptomyces sp. 1331.2]SOB86362.1 hypothetical protein SAMN06272789_6674 [Streptomyces sp. 1331.2]
MTGYVGTPATDGAVSAFTGSDGTLAIYSRNSADSHLQLTYIANNSGTWTTTDLTTSVGTRSRPAPRPPCSSRPTAPWASSPRTRPTATSR